MSMRKSDPRVPAKAGTQVRPRSGWRAWAPACAGAHILILLSACHSEPATAPQRQAKSEAAGKADTIACAQGSGGFTDACTVELTPGPTRAIVTVHNPDGGFHRLRITQDGRGLVAADGAQPARVTTVSPDLIEVSIGADRYRLPATVKGR